MEYIFARPAFRAARQRLVIRSILQLYMASFLKFSCRFVKVMTTIFDVITIFQAAVTITFIILNHTNLNFNRKMPLGNCQQNQRYGLVVLNWIVSFRPT